MPRRGYRSEGFLSFCIVFLDFVQAEVPEVPPEVKALPKKKRRKKKRLSRKPLPEAVVSLVTMAVTAIIKQSGFRYIVPVDDNKLCYILSNHRGHLKKKQHLDYCATDCGL